MTKEQWAEKLNGRKMGEEIRDDDENEALRKDGMVVVFGASDDLTEFRGAFDDEADACAGGEHSLTPTGLLPSHDECDCPFCGYKERQKTAKLIEAIWSEEGYSWTFKTDIPHATFDILEDGEKFCRGIVFEVAALKPN